MSEYARYSTSLGKWLPLKIWEIGTIWYGWKCTLFKTAVYIYFQVKCLPIGWLLKVHSSGRPICRYISVDADISVIGRYIGFADNRNPYRYRLLASADKKANIGSLTDIEICYLFVWFLPKIILSGLEYERKIYFLLLQEHPLKSSSVRNTMIWVENRSYLLNQL